MEPLSSPADAIMEGEEALKDPRRAELPPPKTFVETLGRNMKEVFFPDDPLRRFKKVKGRWRRFVMAVKYVFPIFEWAPSYNLSTFKSDLIAGITIASLAVPQGISYAKLANVPPLIGLYSNFVPPLVYAMMGSSRDLAVGNVATASLVMASVLEKAVSPTAEPTLYLHLAFTAAFFGGVFQAALGLFRLGFIVDFLSHATIVGFMSGTATYVCIQQFKGILGLQHFTHSSDIVSMLESIFSQTHQWRWEPAVMGICFTCFILSTRVVSKKRPNLFWIAAIAPLTSVVIATLAVYITREDKRGMQVIGYMKKGINPPSVTDLVLSGRHMGVAIQAGIISGIIGLTEAMAVGRIFAMVKNYRTDGNKEMLAFGMMNIAGSFTSCAVTAGPFSRTAVNYNSGCKTAMSNVVMAMMVLITLLFLMPLFHYTPSSVLSALIIGAMLGLIDFKHMIHLWHVDKMDFCVCISTYLGVIFGNIEMGLSIGVAGSLLRVLLFVARPRTTALGRMPNSSVFMRMDHNPLVHGVPGFLIIRIDAPLYFANTSYLRERIMRWIEEEEEKLQLGGEANLRIVVLDLSAVGAIDNSGIGLLEELNKILHNRELQLALASPGSEVMFKLYKSKVMEVIGQEWMFLSVGDAIAACTSSSSSSNDEPV